MIITAAAIDDEPLALEVIKNFCDQTGYISLVKTFTKTTPALEFLQQQEVSLLFLDINMPSMSGLELLKKIPDQVLVIFTTAHSEYAVEGFEMEAVDYLLKPFSFDRFKKAADKAREYLHYLRAKNKDIQQYLFIKIDYGIKKVPLAEIRYIEGQDNYLKIHMDNGRHYLVRSGLRAIQQHLPADEFLRVHRSYIVSFKKVSDVRNKTVYLDDLAIPISALYLDDVLRHFS